MKKNGFTLIEVLMGLCLLGLISVIMLPIINSSLNLSNKNFEKIEMTYLGETVIENLKSFKYDSSVSAYICNTEVKEIIDLFKSEKTSSITLDSKDEYENYKITIEKRERSSKLWEVLVFIDYVIKEGDEKGVKYKAFLPSK